MARPDGLPEFRAGWYAPYWVDRIVWRIKDRSAERIIPELQTLTVGDRIPDSPDWFPFFTVQSLEPERALVLYSTTHPLPMYTDVRFGSFVLDDHHGSTRLIMRARMHSTPVWAGPAGVAVLPCGHEHRRSPRGRLDAPRDTAARNRALDRRFPAVAARVKGTLRGWRGGRTSALRCGPCRVRPARAIRAMAALAGQVRARGTVATRSRQTIIRVRPSHGPVGGEHHSAECEQDGDVKSDVDHESERGCHALDPSNPSVKRRQAVG